MNTLIVYDSQFGNTAKLAEQIASTLGKFGAAHATHIKDLKPSALAEVDLLVIGCPTQAWHSTPTVKAFITGLDSQTLARVACAEFDTVLDMPRLLTGSAAKGMAKQLRQQGAMSVAPPESFIVTGKEGPLAEGEMERAVQWALVLHERFEAEQKLSTVVALHNA